MAKNQLFAKKSLDTILAEMAGEHRLRRVLGPVSLSALGIGAIIGTGIFVLVGKAAHDTTGPALVLSFVVGGIACIFAALCYAEFASMAPIAGSAYTYAYTTLGELLAWIIGWDLVLEYAVASATVAHGWSKYFQDFLRVFYVAAALVTLPDMATPNVGLSADVDLVGSNSVGLVARYTGPADENYYLGELANVDGQCVAEISKNVKGTRIQLARQVVGKQKGTLRFDVFGSSLRLYLDGVLVGSTRDSALSAGVVGLRCRNAGCKNFKVSVLSGDDGKKATEVFRDTFKRPDHASLGSPWHEETGDFTIAGERAVARGDVLPKAVRGAPFDYNPNAGEFQNTGHVLDLPAILIAVIITTVLVIGIRESAGFNAGMVMVKLAIVFFVIIVGVFYINPENWSPFAPYGYSGVSFFGKTVLGQEGKGGEPLGMLSGAAIIFFAYIGFDSVSTHSEEARNPRRDVPIGIITSLVVCTLLYVAVSAVLTGMVPYGELNIEAPVSDAFGKVGLPWAQALVSIGAVTGITSVLLVMMLSQPRVLLAMARDGLLPPSFFADIHPRFRTPWKATILTGVVVSVMGAFIPLRVLAELVNIGTLLAFVIVCGAVWIMRHTNPEAQRPFRAPLVPLVPILGIASCLLLMFSLPPENWLRLAVWLLIGFAVYFTYGWKHSHLGRALRREISEHGISPAGVPLNDLNGVNSGAGSNASPNADADPPVGDSGVNSKG